MTLYPPQPRAAASRRNQSVVGGLVALVFLIALVVVPPLALTTFVGNPLPEQAVIAGRITDDAVIGMLAAVVWLAWAQLMLAVLIEAIAAARGAGLPRRIPLCGPYQHLARQLVVAITFLLVGTATATGVQAQTAAAVGSVKTGVCAPLRADLVEQPQIFTPTLATPVVAEIDRRDSLEVPTGPSTLDSRREDGLGVQADEAGPLYEVKPPHGRHHDTLWDIAERHLGDGRRWKEIYELNRHRPQPDGHRLEVARLIYPGWRLLLPADAVGIPVVQPKAPTTDRPTGHADDHKSATHASSTTQVKASATDPFAPVLPPARTESAPMNREARPNEVGEGQTEPKRTEVQPGTTSNLGSDAGASGDEASGETSHDDSPGVPFGALTLGLSALAAAGLTAELARRRRRAQRFRLPGARLRRAEPEQGTAERHLRTANAEVTVDTVRDALRVLAADCHAIGRPLPDLRAVLVNASTVELRLGSDEEPVGPFTATGPRTWRLAGSSDLGGAADDDAVDPYPALVSVGVVDDSVMLINLEAAGTLHIDGPADAAAEIAYAMTAELGTSALTATAELVLTGCPLELVRLTDEGRTRRLASGVGARWAAARVRDVGDALNRAGLRDLADARARRMANDLWAPAVLVEVDADRPHRDEATESSPEPRAGLSLITTARSASTGDGWIMCASGGIWRLEPLGIDVEPQRLSLETLRTLRGLLDVPEQAEPVATSTAQDEPGSGHPNLRIGPLTGLGGVVVTTATNFSSASPTDLAVIAAAIPHPPRSAWGEHLNARSTDASPRVLVLGPVEVVGTIDEGAPNRRRRAIELISYLALHPGGTQHQLDEALWPGRRVSRNTRNPVVSRARQWLGTHSDGEPYLALVGDGGTYSVRPEVTCDWNDFCALTQRGLAAGSDGVDDLVAALELVRGRPFLGVNPATYGWAEADTQDMISAIVDVAHVLAVISSNVGDHRRARWAAARGLLAEPLAELLYRDAIQAATAQGDVEDSARLVDMLRRRLEEVDPDADLTDETALLMGAFSSGA